MDSVLKSMQGNLPGVYQVMMDWQPKIADVQARTDAAVSPIYADTQVQLYDTAGRELNRIGNEIEMQNQLASSEREKAIATGTGRDLVTAANELNRLMDPEFYKMREGVAAGADKLLGSMDPTKLSGSERAEVERGLARMGSVNPESAANTVANATQFGSALQQKQQAFSNVLAQIAGSIPATRTGVNAFEIATKRALTPNAGNANFVGVQSNTGQNSWETGNNFMAQASNLQAIKNQKAKDTMDMIQQGTESFNNVMSSFSFM